MYVLFNNEGVMTAILPHDHENIIRQGSTFDLSVLFEKDNPFLNYDNVIVTMRIKRRGDKTYGTEYIMNYNPNYTFNKINPSEVIFQLVNGREYKNYFMNNIGTYYSARDGNLEIVVTIYVPKDENGNNIGVDGMINDSDKVNLDIKTSGLIHLYVERTLGISAEQAPSIEPSQYEYLIALNGALYNTIDEAVERVEHASIEAAKAYTDAKIDEVSGSIDSMQEDILELQNKVGSIEGDYVPKNISQFPLRQTASIETSDELYIYSGNQSYKTDVKNLGERIITISKENDELLDNQYAFEKMN